MTTLFDSTQDDNSGTIDNTKNYAEELVGDGKKFKTIEDLARGKAEADLFIERLKQEQQELRNDLNQRARLEELLNKIENPPKTPVSNQDNQDGEDGADKTLKLADLETLIEKKVSERERQRIHTQNLEYVKSHLKDTFGSDYTNKLTQTASELGLDSTTVDKMARENPKALLRLVGADAAPPATPQAPSLFSPPRGSQGVPSGGSTSHVRNQAFYDKLKAQNPTDYWSPKIQNQLHKDALDMGEKFFT